ncbi:MAG: hypothetical protein P4M14_00065 [Gammaproteobacteria bacterium]|nr:hypothetical protein [Gammaproteobacteria bacterium]
MEARAEKLFTEVAPFLKENYSTALTVCKLLWEQAEELRNSYSEEEVKIIDTAQKIYSDIFHSNDYPLHISYKPEGKSKRKFPAYEAENKKLAFQPERLGGNEMALPLKGIIIDLIIYFNACKDKWFKGNFHAIKYVFLYLIDVVYVLSKIDLTTPKAMKEVENHLLYVKRLMSMRLLKKNFWGNDYTDASITLAKVVQSLSKQCIPRVVELSNRLDASIHLAKLSTLIEFVCSLGFDITLHLPTRDVIQDNVSLLNIEKEKDAQYGDEEVRKYAMASMDGQYSFRNFLYGFSTSLLNKLRNRNPDRVFRSYIDEPGVSKNLSDPDKGFYFYSNKEFIDYYEAFNLNSERMAFLRQNVEQARNIYANGGNLLYFITNGEAAKELLHNIRDVTKALNLALTKISSIADNEAASVMGKKTDAGNRWHATYAKALDAKLEIEFREKIGEMKERCEKLDALHEYFMENPELRKEEMEREAQAFRKNVFAIKGNLQPKKLQMRQAPEKKEDIEELEQVELAEENAQKASIIPSRLIKVSTFEIVWDFHQVSAQSLRKTLPDLKKQFHLNVTDYANAERRLIEMHNENGNAKNAKNVKQTFKDCQDLYLKLDIELAKIKSNDRDFVALIFLFRTELAHRQAKHIAIILDQKMCGATDMNGSIKRFNDKCLADIISCRGLTEEERDYKTALNNMVFYLGKMLGGDTSYLLKRKAIDEAQPYRGNAIRPNKARFFQPDPFALAPPAPLQHELNHEGADPLRIEDDEDELEEAKGEPQGKPEPDKIVYNENIQLELKEKGRHVVLDEFNFFCYEALKASHDYATTEYNGYNFLWSHSKDHNIERHKRHEQHYLQLLQCSAYLTNGEICTEVKGSVGDITPVTEEKLLQWIENIIREERKYYGQYPLYNMLSKLIEKRNNNEILSLKKAKEDTEKELKIKEEEAKKKEEAFAQQVKELIEKSGKSDEAAKKSAEDAKAKEAEAKAKEAEAKAKDKIISEQSELIKQMQKDIFALKPKEPEKDKLHDNKQPQYKPVLFN